jgi:putative membrane protein insertion efficiency factor
MKKFIIFPIKLYKIFISPFLGKNCRFYPTCSQYAIDAIEKYGILKGLFKSLIRICKCHPFHPGGYDPA